MLEDSLDKKLKIGCFRAVFVEEINQHLFGEIQTLIEASVSDLEQRRAIKSIVSQFFTRATRSVMSRIENFKGDE